MRKTTLHLLFPLIILALLSLACGLPFSVSVVQPTAAVTPLPAQPTQPPAPTSTQAPALTATQPAASNAAEYNPGQGPILKIDLTGAATGLDYAIVPAVSPSDNAPGWDVMPQYTRFDLKGYAISSHLLKPQIFLYPAGELGKYNQAAADTAATLQSLLQSQTPAQRMPFLPFFNAAQVMHAQVKFLDFQNGQGVRYITQYDQAVIPINNNELIYTFQGLTKDGRYYVSTVLPLTHPSLPADSNLSQSEQEAFMNNFTTYLSKTVADLNQQPAESFGPSLGVLDQMIQSIEVK